MKKLRFAVTVLLCVGSLIFTSLTQVHAQSTATAVNCGDVIEGEFTKNIEGFSYTIDLAPGDSVVINGSQIGDKLKYAVGLFSPTGLEIGRSKDGYVSKSPSVESGILSGRGMYLIRVANSYLGSDGDVSTNLSYTGGTGVYSLAISCKLKGGKFIGPSGATESTDETAPNTSVVTNTQPSTLPFSGNGFPGLAPVDFSNVTKIPLVTSQSVTFSPTGSDVFGLTVDAKAGDKFSLNYTRLSGNVNLGLAVLSASNEVIFQASLVTSDMLTTTFTFPTAGTYTIGLFRVNLVTVANPQPTQIVINGKIIP